MAAATGIIALALLGGAPASAAPESEWSKPGKLVSANPKVMIQSPRVGAGPGRYAVVAFTRRRTPTRIQEPWDQPPATVFAMTRRFDGTWSRAKRFSLSDSQLRLAVGPAGDTALAWVDRRQRINVATRRPQGNWEDPRVLTGRLSTLSGSVGLKVAVGADGSVLVGWLARQTPDPDDWAVGSVSRVGRGDFGPSVVHADKPLGPFLPAVAIGSRGNAVIAWTGHCPLVGPPQLAEVAIAEAGMEFAEPMAIPDSKCMTDTGGLHASIDDEDKVAVMLSGAVEAGEPVRRIRIARGSASGFMATEELGGPRAGFGRLAGDASGRLIGVWSEFAGDAREHLIGWVNPARQGALSRSWTRVWQRFARISSLAVGRDGRGIVAWQEQLRPNRIFASLIGPGDESFDPAAAISGPQPANWLTMPEVAREGGSANVVWGPQRNDGGYKRVLLVVDGAAPRCRQWWATSAGSDADDVLRGTRGRRDVITARSGDDRVYGLGGRNWICAGPGDDVIRPGPGGSRVFVGPGNDLVIARARGRNRIFARRGRNTIRCGPGFDRVVTNRRSTVANNCNRVIRR